jgi:hypothetical protein
MVFHRTDIIEKKGNSIKLIEVKAKSSIQRMKIYLLAKKWWPCQWMETLFDLAFRNSWHRKPSSIQFEAYLLMADKKKSTLD